VGKQKLTKQLLEVFAGEREGTLEEQKIVSNITAELREHIYTEAVFILTEKCIEDPKEARTIFTDIIHHHNNMVRVLRRSVSMRVAAIDYVENIQNILKNPALIDTDNYHNFTGSNPSGTSDSLYDRTICIDAIESEIKKTHMFQVPFSIIYFITDSLEEIGRFYGGDLEAKAQNVCAHCIRENLRKEDLVYRYGKNAFIALLPDTKRAQAQQTAQRIVDFIDDVRVAPFPYRLSVFGGITTFTDENTTMDCEMLITSVINAAHEAKRKGNYPLCVYTTEQTDTPFIFISGIIPEQNERVQLKGISLVNGIGIGNVFHYCDVMSREIELQSLEPQDFQNELDRIRHAITKVRDDMHRMKQMFQKDIGPHHAAIFDVHKTILDDRNLLKRIETELQTRMVNGEHVIRNVFRELEKQFFHSESTLLKERIHDLRDIAGRILKVLIGIEDNALSEIPPNAIVFAKRLLPSDTIHFTNKKPVAIVTEEGGPSSHSALIAKAMGIPSVSNVAFTQRTIPDGTTAIVDGNDGTVIIGPHPEECGRFRAKVRVDHKTNAAEYRQKQNAVKRDIAIYANVSSPDDVLTAQRLGCDGIGLYRTEPIYMLVRELPDEEMLFNQLTETLKPVKELEIAIRLADLGGDKVLPYLNIGKEHSSFLGLRGIRFLFHYKDLLRMQLRAGLRLSTNYRIKILLPFITTPSDMLHVREEFQKVKDELAQNGIPHNPDIPLGAMLETPASIIGCREIIEHSDFINIGSNDLVQYVTAADRESLVVSDYYEYGTPLILPMIEQVVEECKKANIACTLCGELAANTNYTEELLQTGLRNFSIAPLLIPNVVEKIDTIITNHSSSR